MNSYNTFSVWEYLFKTHSKYDEDSSSEEEQKNKRRKTNNDYLSFKTSNCYMITKNGEPFLVVPTVERATTICENIANAYFRKFRPESKIKVNKPFWEGNKLFITGSEKLSILSVDRNLHVYEISVVPFESYFGDEEKNSLSC
jgi:hypothetical protein